MKKNLRLKFYKIKKKFSSKKNQGNIIYRAVSPFHFWRCSCRGGWERRRISWIVTRSKDRRTCMVHSLLEYVCMRDALHSWIPQKYHSEIYSRVSEHLRTALYFVSITAEVERDPIVPLLLPWLRCIARCISKHNTHLVGTYDARPRV